MVYFIFIQIQYLFEHFPGASSVTKSLDVDILLAYGDHQLQIFLHFQWIFIPIKLIYKNAHVFITFGCFIAKMAKSVKPANSNHETEEKLHYGIEVSIRERLDKEGK